MDRMMYVIPLASRLSEVEVDEEVKMEGDLLLELDQLFERYLGVSKCILYQTNLACKINATYPAGTSLWTILDSILLRFHLIPVYEIYGDVITLSLEEGSAWRH